MDGWTDSVMVVVTWLNELWRKGLWKICYAPYKLSFVCKGFGDELMDLSSWAKAHSFEFQQFIIICFADFVASCLSSLTIGSLRLPALLEDKQQIRFGPLVPSEPLVGPWLRAPKFIAFNSVALTSFLAILLSFHAKHLAD